MCNGLELSVVFALVTSSLRHFRHFEFSMGERREPTPQLMLQCAVDLRDCKAGAGLRVFQTGRVQQYAAFLFGALVVLGAALVAFT